VSTPVATQSPPNNDFSAPPPGSAPGVPDQIIEQAIAWFVRLASGTQTVVAVSDFARWLAAHPDHADAWRQLQGMSDILRHCSNSVEPRLARSTLERLPATSRRRMLGLLALTAGGIALPLLHDPLLRTGPLAVAISDHHTATGELLNLTLPDGTLLQLNTSTAVNVHFDARERLITLLGGEIMVSTAKTPDPRPLRITTSEGTLMPVGTRFAVRRKGDGLFSTVSTFLSVTDGAVDIRTAAPRSGDNARRATVRVSAGQTVRFDRHNVGMVTRLNDTHLSWAEGTFTAANTRLVDLAADLERYRSGILRVDPAVADLRMTGAWPLRDQESTDRVLDALERHLPVRIIRRTRYWVVIAPA